MNVILDTNVLTSSRALQTIVQVADSHSSLLSLFIDPSGIEARFDARTLRTTVPLVGSLPANRWFLLTASVKRRGERALISTWVDQAPQLDSDICAFSFQDPFVTLSVGGYVETIGERWMGKQMGVVSSLAFYDRPLTYRDVDRLLVEPGCQMSNRVWAMPDIPNAYGAIVKDDLVITEEVYYPRPLNDFCCERSILDTLAMNRDLELLKLLFTYSQSAQNEFCSADRLLAVLLKAPVNSRLYFTIYSIFEVVVDEKLKRDWWSKFAANIWLWAKCDGQSLIAILSHWKTVLIDNCSEFFSDFSSFLSQFA
jgi:hypothetical protein